MKQLLRQVDYLKSTVDEIDRQLSEWKMQQSEGKQLNEHIEAFTALRDFYEDNGKLLMIELDVTESFRHIVGSKEDWEYRFFARRLFTLMHETRNALLASLGSHRNQMMKFAPTTFAQYESIKKRWKYSLIHMVHSSKKCVILPTLIRGNHSVNRFNV